MYTVLEGKGLSPLHALSQQLMAHEAASLKYGNGQEVLKKTKLYAYRIA